MANLVELGIQYFNDPVRGRPIYRGYIYVGEPDTDPEDIPNNLKDISVITADGTTLAVSQPLRTNTGGNPTYNGEPVKIVTDGAYSLLVQDLAQRDKFYIRNSLEGVTETGILFFGTRQEMTDYSAAASLTDGTPVFLSESPRSGMFQYRAGDYSSEIATDPEQGVYVTATGGAFVRSGFKDGEVSVSWWGAQPIGAVEVVDSEVNGGDESIFDNGFDSGTALAACWQWVIDTGGGAPKHSSGVYKTSETLPMDVGLIPTGEGYTNTQIKLAAGANRDVIAGRDFNTFFNTDSWIVRDSSPSGLGLKLPWGYGMVGICIDGNRDNNTAGYGWKCYGKMRYITDCMFKNCYQWGFLNAAGTSRGQADFRDIPEAIVQMVCRNNRIGGMWGLGPHDMMYEHVVSAINGRDENDWDIIIEDDGVMSGGGRFKFLHTYGTPASGVFFRNIGIAQGDHMVAENGCRSEGSGGYWNLIQNGSAAFGTALRVDGGGYLVGKMRISTNDPTHDGFYLDGADFQVANMRLQGDVGSTGTGIDVRSDGFKCGSFRMLQFDTGLSLGTVSSVNNAWIGHGEISSCTTAFSYPSAGSRNEVNLLINIAAGQTSYSGVNPSDDDRFNIRSYGNETRSTRRVIRVDGAIDAVGQQTVSFDPELMFDPDLSNITVTVVGATSSAYSLDYEPRVNGTPTASNIDIRYDVGTAAPAASVMRIAVNIDESTAEEIK